jgi:CRP-like cAMP-binding protein
VATPAERAKAIARQATAAGRRVMGKAGRGAAAAAAWSGKAARWSGAKGRSLAESAKRLMSSVSTPRIDPLKELADSARYAAVSNRLNAIASLSPIEIEKLRNSLPDRRIHQAGSELRVEGESADSALFIATGWAARIRMSPRGRRQIVGFLVAGDGIALHTSPGAINNTTVVALTSVETVSADGVLKMARDRSAHPRISEAITRLCAADDALLVNQVMRLGALEAPDRLAHLLLELHWRLQVAGLATDQLFPLPLNVDTLSDALNLRPRSVQRILFQFERRGFIKRGYGRILIRQADRLAKLSGFAPPTLAISESARRLVRDIHGETGTGLAASDKPTQAPSELELGPDMVVDPPPAPRRSSAGSARS